MNKKQRSTKAERQAAESILKGLIEKAYKEGEVVFDYAGEGEVDAEYKSKILHQALNDYRKKVRARQTENFDLFMMTNACSILKESDTSVTIRRKAGRFSDRTQTILDVVAKHPELGLGPKQTTSGSLGIANIGAIVADAQNGN